MPQLNQNDDSNAIAEVQRLTTGEMLPFSSVIDSTNEPDSYYAASPLAFILRILRSDRVDAGERPAFIQIFDFKGRLLGQWTHYIESSGMFFAQFPYNVRKGHLHKLSCKPTFVKNTNITHFGQVVPDSHFDISGVLWNDPPPSPKLAPHKDRQGAYRPAERPTSIRSLRQRSLLK